MRRVLPIIAILLSLAVPRGTVAAGIVSSLPLASEPLGNIPDAVLLDQGTGCPTAVNPCTTSQAPSLRLGQPFQGTSPPATPFLFQQWWNTNSPTLVPLNLYDGNSWNLVGTLDTTNHLWTPAGIGPLNDPGFNSLVLGNPTGGHKGVGTLNPAGAIYDNGTAPTGTASSGYVRATAPTIVNAMVTTPILGMPITISNAGVSRNTLSWGQEDALVLAGLDAGKTTSLQIGPATSISTGTISELVLYRTIASSQGFGGNYGRWSLTNIGTNPGNVSGLFGEYGGTAALAPFIMQVGIENPPSTFTTFEGWRFNTAVGSAEDDNQGSVTFGLGATVPRNQITLAISSIGAPGTRDSHAFLWEGKANDGTERAVWWRARAHPTTNAGLSSFILQQNLNGGGWTTKLTMDDAGNLTVPGAVTASVGVLGGFGLPFPRTVHTGGIGGTAASNQFTSQIPVATEVYTCEIFIPAAMQITGVALLNSSTISGNVKVGLVDKNGNVLATSVSTAQAGTNVFQRIPFTVGYAAPGPASFYVVVFFDNNTTRPWAHTVGTFGTGVLAGQTYATGFVSSASLAPSTFTAGVGPVATLY